MLDQRLTELLDTDLELLSYTATVICIWIIALITVVWAYRTRTNPLPIITESEPPVGCSPVFAQFILSSGKQGGVAGEISSFGTQTIVFMSLYETGLLNKLSVSSAQIEYSINPDFEKLSATEDEKLFVSKLAASIGTTGTLTAAREADAIQGYPELSNVWMNFWYKDLQNIAAHKKYIRKDGLLEKLLSVVAASITFGAFFGIFTFFFIPFIGKYITAILILPILGIYLLNETIFGLLLNGNYLQVFEGISSPTTQGAVFVISFFSWFAWFVLFGQNMSKINRALTPEGLELVRKIQGYKQFLATVDKDRLSFSFNRSLDFERNKTSFAWLAIFELVTDKHWQQWYEATDTSVAEPAKIHI